MTTIKAYMQYSTKFADGTLVGNEAGGPCFPQAWHYL